MALVSRFAGEQPLRQIEAGAPAPYPLAGDVYPLAGDVAIDGVWLPDAPHQVRDLGAELRFSTGELSSKFIFAASRNAVHCEVLTFASREDPTLVCQELSLTAERAAITWRCMGDGRSDPKPAIGRQTRSAETEVAERTTPAH